MPTKPRLSPQQHIDMGRTLAAIRDELARRATQLKNAYPQTGREAAPSKSVTRALRALDNARNDLDNAMFREHPDTAVTTAYYPHPEDRPWRLRDRGNGAVPTPEDAPEGRCPACSAPSHYVRDLDRYVHGDGSSNRQCWLQLSRGTTAAPVDRGHRPALLARDA